MNTAGLTMHAVYSIRWLLSSKEPLCSRCGQAQSALIHNPTPGIGGHQFYAIRVEIVRPTRPAVLEPA